MKILALSDRVNEAIYSPQIRDLYGDIDLVVGCGDLPYYYLEYVVSLLPIPVAYVFGNHDQVQYMADGRKVTKPEGCISLEGRTMMIKGVILAGLGGSMRYNLEVRNQYTQAAMTRRVLWLAPALLGNRLRYGRYLDVLVTHSPPHGIHDEADLPHQGFHSLLTLMRIFKPKYMLHGHTHLYRKDAVFQTRYQDTEIINVYPNRLIEWDIDE